MANTEAQTERLTSRNVVVEKVAIRADGAMVKFIDKSVQPLIVETEFETDRPEYERIKQMFPDPAKAPGKCVTVDVNADGFSSNIRPWGTG